MTSPLVRLRDAIVAGSLPNFSVTEAAGLADYINHLDHARRGSVDAALAFKDAVLPGWTWTLGVNAYHGYASACVRRLSEAGDRIEGDADGQADTPARALLLACLTALIEKETT